MKCLVFLFVLMAFNMVNGTAQQMLIPAPNTSNVLFLKFSYTLNSPYSYIPESNVSRYPDPVNFKPVYSFNSGGIKNASSSIIMNFFYVPNPDEFAYIDPAVYDAVSLSRVQLVDILKIKTIQQEKNYLNSFTTIYLIDNEQKNPNNPNQVKILKVKPHYSMIGY